jgi:hypothetical protein
MAFPDGEALAAKMRGHGLTDVRWYPLTFGIATLYVGTKRSGLSGSDGIIEASLMQLGNERRR